MDYLSSMLERRISLFLVILTFCLLLLGGIVHNTGSSLACPDWPLCFGSLLPEMKGNVAVEHSHRLVATTVGLLTILLAVLLWKRRREDRRLQWLGVVAVFCVVVQGILGGITVIYRLPTLISTAHLGVSMIFFSLMVVIAWRTGLNPPLPPFVKGGVGGFFVKFTTLLLYLQIVLGAFVRHSGAGLVCPDIPLCYGSVWPAVPVQRWQMVHRGLAVSVAVIILFLPLVLRKRRPLDGKIGFLAFLAPVLVLIQIVLGIASVKTLLGLPAVTAHLGVAALLLGTMVSLWVVTSSRSLL